MSLLGTIIFVQPLLFHLELIHYVVVINVEYARSWDELSNKVAGKPGKHFSK